LRNRGGDLDPLDVRRALGVERLDELRRTSRGFILAGLASCSATLVVQSPCSRCLV
jgi:hypothetical protein